MVKYLPTLDLYLHHWASKKEALGTRPGILQHQGNLIPAKDHNNLPVTENIDMKICDLSDKEARWTLRKCRMAIQ